MTVQIKIDQPGSGAPAGVAGRSREDLRTTFDVQLSAIGGPFLAYQWTLVDRPIDIVTPAASAAAVATPNASVTLVTPIDQVGTYLVELAVDAGYGVGARPEDVARATFYAGVTLNYLATDPRELPRRIPAFRERADHNAPDAIYPSGNARGWAQEWLRWFSSISRLWKGLATLRNGALASNAIIPGVAATPGWTVISEFDLEFATSQQRLDAIMLVSNGALTGNMRLYDVTGAAVVAGSALTTVSLTGARITSGDLSSVLTAGNRYQIQAECVGGAAPADFGIVRYATLRGD